MFSGLCKNSRDCLTDQVCIRDTCRITCNANDTCPDFQYCKNRICVKEIQCISDNDCTDDERCFMGKNEIPQCVKVCDRYLCGRQAVCVAKNHQASCACNNGFSGDPIQGCRKKQCDLDSECTDDKICDENMCKIACLVGNNCGDNSICSSEKHNHLCYCQPGFTGDPIKGCIEINWCISNPCGNGAECKNSRDRAQCSCPTGTVGDPNGEGCNKAQECRFNRDCPSGARCTVKDGIRKCTGKSNDL